MQTIRPSLWKVTVEPAAAVVTTAEAKAHLRVDFAADDDLIANLVTAATKRCEAETGLALIDQTIRAEMLCAPGAGVGVDLPVAPYSSITSVTYRDSANATQTLDAASYEVISGAHSRATLVEADGYSWPSTRDGAGSFVVTYVAGFGATAASIPMDLKQGILLLVGLWYSNREDAAPVDLKRIPQAAAALFSARRARWFA